MEAPTLRQLEYAVAVADHKHFGQAARAVNVSQPGLSSQIAELETRLGVRLFERAPRKVDLTGAGADVIARARTILRDVDDVVLRASVHSKALVGPLKVGVVSTVVRSFLPFLLRSLESTSDYADIELHELPQHALIPALISGDLDTGLLVGTVDASELRLEPLAAETLVLVLPSGHRLADRASIITEALSEYRILIPEAEPCLAEQIVNVCNGAGIADRRRVENASLSTMVQLVAAGQGMTFIPDGNVDVHTGPNTGVCTVPIRRPAPTRTISLAWRRTDPRCDHFESLSAAVSVLISDRN